MQAELPVKSRWREAVWRWERLIVRDTEVLFRDLEAMGFQILWTDCAQMPSLQDDLLGRDFKERFTAAKHPWSTCCLYETSDRGFQGTPSAASAAYAKSMLHCLIGDAWIRNVKSVCNNAWLRNCVKRCTYNLMNPQGIESQCLNPQCQRDIQLLDSAISKLLESAMLTSDQTVAHIW